jgi:hypothetical protein
MPVISKTSDQKVTGDHVMASAEFSLVIRPVQVGSVVTLEAARPDIL